MRAFLLGFLVVSVGCITEDPPPLTDDTELRCPINGLLPFRTKESFKHDQNYDLVREKKRSKDEASDTIGNPNGPYASIYIAQGQAPTPAPISYRGAKARTLTTGGYFATPIQDERVSLWTYDGASWMEIAATRTAEDGTYELPDTGYVAENARPIYSMLDADHTCAEHFTFLYPRGSKVVLSDIDGTLTLDDMQLLDQIPDEAYVPKMMGAADRLTQTWAMKGYPIIYLTARPHVFRPETRVWLRDLGFPLGAVITAADVGDAAPYKKEWVERIQQTFGWTIVAAYGNADTDITAYEEGGIPKDLTFIAGPLAGTRGTVAIDNMDYSAHISTFVTAQPDNR